MLPALRRGEEADMRRMFGFLIGTFVGALVGSTVALLLAPESGEELRAQLRVRAEGLVAEVRGAAEARRAELTDRLQSLREPRTGPSELS
jgi:gas vesicle protein